MLYIAISTITVWPISLIFIHIPYYSFVVNAHSRTGLGDHLEQWYTIYKGKWYIFQLLLLWFYLPFRLYTYYLLLVFHDIIYFHHKKTTTQKRNNMAYWVQVPNMRIIWGSIRSLIARLDLCWKWTGTLVTKLIRYCNQSVLAW